MIVFFTRFINHPCAFAIALLALFLSGCERRTTLEEVQEAGVLRMVTRNAPTTYYLDRTGPTGFEYHLARLFAKELGVKLEITTADSIPELLAYLTPGQQRSTDRMHMGAAQLGITPGGVQQIAFGPSYDSVRLQLVYNRKNSKPAGFDALNGSLQVMAGSSAEYQLRTLAGEYDFDWSATTALEAVDLLKQVNDGELDYTIVDSNNLAMNFLYFPDVRVAFELPAEASLAWVFADSPDRSLIEACERFFSRIQADGTLTQLHERFYGHLEQLNYVGAKTFLRQLNQRLPRFQSLFKDVAEETGLDWRFLAAIGYQESHWRAKATSPTGVRGLMMLTKDTAREMKVSNRLDPEQSIRGGARYFLKLKERLPERITEPDRTWLALAAYNVGLGHLEDARVITERRGGNPDKWIDIKDNLPLLSDRRWYSTTRYGYARGYEPVLYVQNIRRYQSMLRWLTHPPREALLLDTPLNQAISEQTPLEPRG